MAQRSRSAAAIADVITFDGRRYRGVSLRTHPPFDRTGRVPPSHFQETGTAARPGGRCANRSDADAGLSLSVQVASIEGVDPEIAVAAIPHGIVYLREGAVLPEDLTSAPWIQWRFSG